MIQLECSGFMKNVVLIVSWLLAIVPVSGMLWFMWVTDSSYEFILEVGQLYAYVPFWFTLLVYSPIFGMFQLIVVLALNFISENDKQD